MEQLREWPLMSVFRLPGVGRVVFQHPQPMIPESQCQYQRLVVVFQPLGVLLQHSVFQFPHFQNRWLVLMFQPLDVVLQPLGSQFPCFQLQYQWLVPMF